MDSISEPTPPQSPLFRIVTDTANDTTKYLIAYRAATLLPASGTNIPSSAYAGTVGIKISDSRHVSTNIEVHAEDVYIYAGSHFKFPPGRAKNAQSKDSSAPYDQPKSVTLMAHRIFSIPNPAAPGGDIQIDCSGADADTSSLSYKPGDAGPNGSDGLIKYNTFQYRIVGRMGDLMYTGGGDWEVHAATAGGKGDNGANGTNGTNGGKITIAGSLIALNGTPTTLYLNVSAGRGSRGLSGGEGGNAGTIQVHDDGYEADQRLSEHESQFAHFAQPRPDIRQLVAPGGPGGNGGSCGINGSGGRIVSVLTTDGLFNPKFSANSPTDGAVAGGPAGQGGLDSAYPGKSKDAFIAAQSGSAGQSYKGALSVGQLVTTSPPPDTKTLSQSPLPDPVQLIMVVQRLNFEYYMYYGSQVYAAATVADQQAKAFSDSVAWLSTTVQQYDETFPLAKPSLNLPPTVESFKRAFAQLLARMKCLSDVYGNSFNYVPDPTVALKDVEKEVSNWKAVEDRLRAAMNVLVNRQDSGADLSAKIGAIGDQEDQLNEQINTRKDQLEHQYTTIHDLQNALGQKKKDLEEDLKDVWAKASSFFGCSGVSQVLSAGGSVLNLVYSLSSKCSLSGLAVFAGPEAGAAYAVGSVVSVGAAGMNVQSGVEPDDPTIHKDAIENKLDNIEAGLDLVTLQKRIQQSVDGSSILDEKEISGLVDLIVTERSQFLQLCNSYFDDKKIPGLSATKVAFDDFLNMAQEQNLAIHKYNQLVVQYEKTKIDADTAAMNNDILRNAASQLSTADLDLLYAYYLGAVTAQKSHALESLYHGVRAYNCASMSYSKAFKSMTALESFDNVDSDTLKTALTAALQTEIVHFQDGLKDFTLHTNRTVSINPQNHPILFNQFKNDHSMAWYPTPEDQTLWSLDRNFFDIRLSDFQVILIGAESAPVDGVNHQLIDILLEFGSTFIVVDEASKSHEFQQPATTTTFSYNYKDPNSQNVADYTVSSSRNPYLTEFKYSDSNGPYSPFPLSSPFTRWGLSVDPSAVIIDHIQEVRIIMDVFCRSRGHAKPAVAFNISNGVAKVDTAGSDDILEEAELPQRAFVRVGVPTGIFRTIVRQYLFRLNTRLSMRGTIIAGGISTAGVFGNAVSSMFPQVGERIQLSFTSIRAPWAAAYGDTPEKQAKAIVGSTDDIAKRQGVQLEYASTLSKLADAALADGKPRDGANFSSYKNTDDGHEAYVAGIKNVGKDTAARLMDPKQGIFAMIKSFPNEVVTILSPEHSVALLKATDKVKYMKDNYEAIKWAEQDMIERGVDPTGCVVQLSGSSFIGINSVDSFQKGGVQITSFVAVTTDTHALDGKNTWMMIQNQNRPEEVLFSNVLIGNHTIRPMDWVNCTMGDRLMETMRRTTPYYFEAKDRSLRVLEVVAEKEPALLAMHLKFNMFDTAFGDFGVEMRHFMGTNTVYGPSEEVYNTQGHELNLTNDVILSADLPTAPKGTASGAYIDGLSFNVVDNIVLQDSSTAGSSLLNPISTEQQSVAAQVVDKITKYNRSEDVVNKLKGDVSSIVEDQVTGRLSDTSVAPPAPSALYDNLSFSTTFTEAASGVVSDALMDGDTVAAVADELYNHQAFSNLKATGNIDLASRVAVETSYRRTVLESLKPNGIIRTWSFQRLISLLTPRVKPLDINSVVDASLKNYQSTLTTINKLNANIAQMAAGDPRVKEANEELRQAEFAIVDAEQAIKDAHELMDLKQNAEQRQAELAKEEQYQRSSIFEEGSDIKDKGENK
ncbi:predicted protein [Paecilomyces variotii No. 5]|uniref:Uncharacterized protein n=1 Tax=Byssochlamys spectabilis (strain No. 5 / NBRC 109023) TaxID=1356009 RepID=V5FCK1_BYSSN|nr:predicted protein [Paecilomyces variotii No. 5]